MKPRRLLRSILALGLMVAFISSVAPAQEDEALPRGIIPGPPESPDLKVDLRTDRTRFPPGAEIELHYQLNKRAYLYVFNVDTEGKVNLLFPNRYDRDNFLESGKGKLPGKGYSFVIDEKIGTEYIQAIASTKPLDLFEQIDDERFQQNPFPTLSDSATDFARTGEADIKAGMDGEIWSTHWIQLRVTRKVADISVISSPEKAEIYVDGNLVGKTPSQVAVEPGTRRISLKYRRYQDWTGEVTVEPYQRRKINVDLQPARLTWLTVNSTPEGARVYVDGELKGTTPGNFTMDSGKREIKVVKEGHETWKKRVEAEAGAQRKLDLDLSRIRYSTLRLRTTPPGARITIDGEYMGTTPARLKLRSGTASIRLKKSGYKAWAREITLKPDATDDIKVELRRTGDKDDPFAGTDFSLVLNAGGLFDTSLSLGSEISVNDFVIGGSFRSTGSKDIPDEINWVEKTWTGGRVVNYGPEWEVYLGYDLRLTPEIYARAGAGLAIQPRANLAPVNGSTSGNSAVKPLITVKRNAALGLEPHLTAHGGIGIRRNGYSFALTYHNRRGPILSVGLVF